MSAYLAAYDGAPELTDEQEELLRTIRSLPLRERLVRTAALTDRYTLGVPPEDGMATQPVRSKALRLAAYDAEHGTAAGPVEPASLTTDSTLDDMRTYIRQEYAAHRARTVLKEVPK
ncbi:hypothetical protein [Streptomyces hydrogenans]|uniref:hypothetical protein n=1 Tax=Streptomyces hydrogenans TaxID=1873719 RepID=UPI0036EFE1F8